MEPIRRCNGSNGAVELTGKNIGVTIGITNFVFIYVHNEKYGSPPYEYIDQLANSVKKAFPRRKDILVGKVSCQKNEAELIRLGFWREYSGRIAYRNGQRVSLPYSTPPLDYILKDVRDPIKQFHDNTELEKIDRTKHLIIGYFDREDMPEYDNFRRVAHNLKKNCLFYIRYGYPLDEGTSTNLRPPNHPTIIFRPGNARSSKIKRDSFKGCVKNYDDLNLWAHKKCMVRELTLDNYEELHNCNARQYIELYYNPSNPKSLKDFCDIVGRTFINRSDMVHCVAIDGIKFAAILQPYRKNKKGLPFIMRDAYMLPNFRDMYCLEKWIPFVSDKFFCHRRYSTYHCSMTMGELVKAMRKKKSSTNTT